ncbi:negative elongation factor D-like [Oppia nitens]|uniref:negative elongation factor D-like n=1 Tax=Oppia nitens TaxID=1686743 RepID=UPI0023DB6683|nr:negative elongation factor D-like [Oppia nitens]
MDSDTDYDEEDEDQWSEARETLDIRGGGVAVDDEDNNNDGSGAAEEDKDDDQTDVEEADDDNDDDDEPMDVQNKDQTLDDCLRQFAAEDYIMEPGIKESLIQYFQSGGTPEQVVELLSDNYHAIAQTANLLAEWLIMTDLKISEVQSLVEDHLKHMIIKHFDPKKADTIFETTGTPQWLTEMIEHQTWRSLIYKLAEDYPDCLMLTFTVKLISDAGFQGEITSISTASQQLEVFSRILKTSTNNFLEKGEETLDTNINEFIKMVCHGEHTFLYSQAMMNVLSQEAKGGQSIKRLSQEISNCASKHGHDATPILLSLNGASAHPRVSQALTAMLSKNALNPADITVLYKSYQAQDSPPPVELLRVPQLLELLLDALFKPQCKLHPEHKPKYIYLLAYGASVYETYTGGKKSVRRTLNRDELKGTVQAIEKVSTICTENKGSSELLPELNSLFQCIRYPVCGLGLCQWVRNVVSERTYFQLSTEHTPLHLALLDEVTTCHTTLHSRVLDLYIQIFEEQQEELEVLAQLEVKKMLLDRMVHLLSRGCVVPVINYIKQCIDRGETDMSLIRYFVCEVLDVITPPFSTEFVQLFYPVVNNTDVTGSLRSDTEQQLVQQFLTHCRQNYKSFV